MHARVPMMNRRTITKRLVQTVAVAFGVLGLMMVVLGFRSAVVGIKESDRFGLLCMTPVFLVFGGIEIAIAYQNLRHFGPNAIRNVTCLVTLTLYGTLAPLDPLEQLAIGGVMGAFVDVAIHSIPLLLAVFFYLVVSKKLIRITEVQSIPPDAGPDIRDGVGQPDGLAGRR